MNTGEPLTLSHTAISPEQAKKGGEGENLDLQLAHWVSETQSLQTRTSTSVPAQSSEIAFLPNVPP